MPVGQPARAARRAPGAAVPPPSRDPLVRTRLLGEQVRGAPVGLRALRAGELRVDTAADDRMDERQWQARLEDPRSRQQLGCLSCLRLFELRESSSVREVTPLENRQSPCEPPGMVGQSTESEVDRPTDRPCADSFGVASSLRGRSDPSLVQRPDELPQEERRSFRRLHAGVHKGRVGGFSERRFHQLGDGGSRQR